MVPGPAHGGGHIRDFAKGRINDLFPVFRQDERRAAGRWEYEYWAEAKVAGIEDAMTKQSSDPGTAPTLAGRYLIHPDKPLPARDHAAAFAVEATDKRAPARGLIAMVCRPGLVPRLDIIPQLSRLMRLPMITPIESGPVVWPESGGRRFVVLFEHSLDRALAGNLGTAFEALRGDQIIYHVVKPILPALKELSGRSIKHRAIRADNVFYSDSTCQSTVLGECVSGPTGMSQPKLYEPIDLAMANDSGRGQGTLADDMYAMGIMIAVLLNGGNPTEGMSDEEIVADKIRHGSYSAVTKNLNISLRMIEPLRGLLCDDPSDRWTIDELELWASGRQLSPKQPMLPAKASRAIVFGETEHMTRPGLSYAMGCRWEQAAKLVTSGELANWLRRSFGDEDSADAIDDLIGSTGEGKKAEDRLISSALMVLEPNHPLRYRQISARIDGLAATLAINYRDEEFRNTFIEMMQGNLPQIYLKSSGGDGRSERAVLTKTFDMFSYFLARQQPGNGLERALYEGNRGWPCQSPLIADDYVCELVDLLPVLEGRARQASANEQLIDRHLAGFCAARSKTLAECVPKFLSPTVDEVKERLGALSVYAEVHRISGPSERYPALTALLAAMVAPVYESYRNRALREQKRKAVERIGGKGNLTELSMALNDASARRADADGFADARKEYGRLENNINWLTGGGLSAPGHVQGKGRQAATFLSAMISSIAVLALSIIFVT